jgi:SAM-dependent methyltransferase
MRHRFHSICPYFAMFPESFVEDWIARIVPPGATVLDPFCGRGTTPFQAVLMGREAVACDVNPVAFCITHAKTNAPTAAAVRARLTRLQQHFDPLFYKNEAAALPEFFHRAYHASTLPQILHLRKQLKWQTSKVDCMLAALALGSLHGECDKSTSYFSNQMPRTISPKPGYSVRFWKTKGLVPPERDVFEILRGRISFRYETNVPSRTAQVFWSDMRSLSDLLRCYEHPIRFVITSPPYFDVTNFEEDQWLRLWFLGNDPKPTYGIVSRDDRHSSPHKYWDMIADLWRSLGLVLDENAQLVFRMGARDQKPTRIADCLQAASCFSGRKVRILGREVTSIRNRQTDHFRPGSRGCLVEVDVYLEMQ